MSKDKLKMMCQELQSNSFSWSLYFFKIDRRARQPYKMYKVRFKNAAYLSTYASNLINTTSKFQIEAISAVQNYDGENTKITCDKLQLNDALIAEQWTNLYNAVVNSSDNKIEGKINGYILVGQPLVSNTKPVIFIKLANPITKLSNKRSVVFSSTVDDELDLVTDEICRLYLTVDLLVYDEIMYTFNHSFESLFNIEKTMSNVRTAAIDSILAAGAISNAEEFRSFATSYKSARTFITLNQSRIERIKDRQQRCTIATMLHLNLDKNEEFVVSNEVEASLLLRYLCYKIFQDSETDDILEASTIVKIDLV